MNSWITSVLPAAPARVLDAGCGAGTLAAQLIAGGYDVTAIDLDPSAALAAGVPAVRADLAGFEAAPFEAIVMRMSLHHMEPMEMALNAAARLLAPGGSLVVDDFAWERADPAAATWFYDAGAVIGGRDLVADPANEWEREHGDLATGEEMLAAISARFDVKTLRRVPFLHRYLKCEGERAERLRTIEELRHPLIGLRVLAVSRGTDGT
ncbi:class I SAM-dependent methyltransferase [Nonomuraea longicatena]|uniref:Methyltransferase n=1 Tax=Nonomuraea longicatena TaxID=83682 RepID=A0ABN1PRI5_9ACTN